MKASLSLLFVLVPCLAFAVEPEPHRAEATNAVRLTPAYVNSLVEVMRTNHPALRAFDARVRAASHATNAVRTWEDPQFSFGGTVTSPRGFNTAEEGDLVYGLEQKLPLFGKPAASRRVAQAEAETELARRTLEFQSLRRDLAKLLFKTGYEEQLLVIGRQDLAWLDTMAATAEERYRAGSASQVEVLRLQNERAKRAALLRTDAQRRDHSRLSVNRALSRELHAAMPRFLLPEIAPPLPYSSNLVSLAVRNEPRLRVMSREIQAAEAWAATTRKARLPDVSGFIEGRQYSSDGGFREGTFGVKLTLPWFNGGKYRSDLARDRARADAVQLDAENYAQAVREEVHHLTVDIDAAYREALLYRDEILPRSRQALTVAHEQWANNRGMLNDVMESRRMLLEAQLMLAKAVSEQHQALSELVLRCGLGDFEALQMFGVNPGLPPESKP